MSTNPRNSTSKPKKGPERQGSVKRARQMLAAGERPKVLTPVENEPEVSSKASHMTQWPLPDNSTLPGNLLDPQASLIPRGPPPPRPPRPDMPSPSIYPERSAPGVAPSPLHIKQTYPSFSQPFPRTSTHYPTRETSSPVSRPGAAGFAPQIAVTNEDSPRRSAVSDTASIPTIPDFPLPATKKATPITHRKSANLAAPQPPPLSNAVRHAFSRRSSVSPIPEELSDEPSNVEGSYASSKAVPSWGSAQRDSDVLGAYLDDKSDDDEESRNSNEENGEGLVRHASVGKRGKPSLRVIQKPTSSSPVPTESGHSTNSQTDKTGPSLPGATGTTGAREDGLKVSSPKESVPSISDRSYEFDLEKGAFMLDIGQSHTMPQQAQGNGTGIPGNGAEGLPGPTPTISVRRPGACRPPRLDMNAVRDAEARGSLTSLSDLIRRATKLATNLDHGRTASRNDILNGNGDSRAPPWGWRNSGSLKGALASFPPPPRLGDGHSSWPAFFRRSTFHNIEDQAVHSDHDQEKQSNHPRRCCGMRLWLFITICVVILLTITLAVLLPVFLVAVPQENSNDLLPCEKSSPCKNGGVSVSSGSICSCVCTNGYTGSQCMTSGDSSCTTIKIGQNSASTSATMGSDLPQLLEDSQKIFSIPLDPVTIMALFSQNDVSCTTQNELVSFNDVSNNSNSNTRRSFPTQQSEELLSDTEPSPSTSDLPLDRYRQTLAARASVATMNGIVFDNSSPSEDSSAGTQTTASAAEETASPQSTSTSTPTTTAPISSATTASTSTPTSVPQKTVNFSRTAVLYIMEMTGAFDAAMESEESIQFYLKNTYPTSRAGRYNVKFPKTGVKSSFSLDFDKYSITMSNGTSVGGS